MARIDKCPVILFCRGSSYFYNSLKTLQPAAIGLDWQCDIAAVRREVPCDIALQGNLAPDILLADRETVRREATRMLEKMRGDKGYICNLGHGILPTTPVDNVRVLVETVKSFV